MRHIRYTLLYIVAVIASMTVTVGCTQNKGYIGDWFGIWRVGSIEIDNEPDTDYAPPYMYWKFQSKVIQMLFVDDESEHTANFCYGSWEESDGYLTLDFDWDLSIPPAFTHLGVVSRLKIVRKTGRELYLQYIDGDGHTINYKLQKWG
ncbi:MAG: lipocalin-like domain-containing protein [Muribaculaceae bacterium]|nr:lipocalin-like domain-containing protein [Muribaculaceae bacterium]